MIPLGSETLFTIHGFKITNTVTATILSDSILLAGVFFVNRSLSLRPGKLQSIMEMIIENFYSMTEQVAGKRAASIFPWFATFFIFIAINNLLALLPGYGQFGVYDGDHHFLPFLRAPSSDLNTTLALAVISVTVTQFLSIKYIGIKKYILHFFPMSFMLFIGILELLSELTKLISFSFRLFGNIFAGEMVLEKVGELITQIPFIHIPTILNLPFLCLEFIVAVVQALVFGMLTMVFMSILSEDHEQH